MKRGWILLAAAVWLAVATVSWAFDTVKTTKKGPGSVLRGRVLRMTTQEIELEPSGVAGMTKTVPVNEIQAIFYDEEPSSLASARGDIAEGKYDEADEALGKINADDLKRAEVTADVEFYKALSASRQALGGNVTVMEAGRQMTAFIKNNPSNYHYLEACEVMGNLAVANGSYVAAEENYRKLAQAPWDDYKMRAGIGMGRALLAQGKTAAAQKAFEEVIGNETPGDQIESQRQVARLGKARCLAASQKTAEAIRMTQEIIDKADKDDSDLLGEAYNTLGTALRKAGRVKDAELAFLHVDVLYNTMPDAHAEALSNLVDLFGQLKKPDKAGRCQQILKQQYPNSPWAKGKE
jgi:tetratricopeptide (TPR) repeat protein